jgi:hypothetical protein
VRAVLEGSLVLSALPAIDQAPKLQSAGTDRHSVFSAHAYSETMGTEPPAAGLSGWSEIVAADGYVLRCEWSKSGGRLELQYFEKRPVR